MLRQGDGLVIQRLCHLSRARLVPVLYLEGPAICRVHASLATALKTTLITHNLWEFERIDGLQVADWAAP